MHDFRMNLKNEFLKLNILYVYNAKPKQHAFH